MLNATSRFVLRVVGSLVALVAAALAVWILGRRYGQSPRVLAYVIVGLGLVWLAVVVVAAITRARRRARLSNAPRRSGGGPVAGPEASHAAILGQRLERTVQWLRKSKLAKSGDVVYSLPWYLLVGTPGAGKSSVVLQSGLAFSYTEPKRPQGRLTIVPTDSWDVWVANEAVFIDPSGKGLMEDKPVEAWRSALDEVRVHRRSKPVDGVVLVADIADLVSLDANGLRDRADRLRAVVDATIERFAMVLPIYVLFHKCDRLRGFTEYVDAVGEEGEAPFGFTFTREQYTSGQPGVQFDAEFDRLADSLLAHRRGVLARSAEASRGGALVFPHEFALLKERLSSFVDLVFAPNQFRRTPVLRGVYFTSAMQGGPSLDLSARRVSAAAGLPAAAPVEGREGSRSYFIRPLFGRVIFPDRTLAGLSSEVLRRRRLARAAALVVATALVPLLTLPYAWSAYRDSLALKVAVQGAGQIAPRSGKTAENVRLLAEVKRALEPFECRGQTPACATSGRRFYWGLHPGDASISAASRMLAQGTRTLFVEPLFASSKVLGHTYNGLRTELQAMAGEPEPAAATAGESPAAAGAPPAAPAFDAPRAYMLLRTLLMLSSESRADPTYLAGQIEPQWLQGVRDTDVPLARELMQFYLHQLGDHHNAGYVVALSPADKALVAGVRSRLLGVRPEAYYYAMIRDEGRKKLDAIRLAAVIGKENPAGLQSAAEVEGIFTRHGWDSLVKDRIGQMKADYERERSWVLGLAEQPGQAPIDELLKAQYALDYEQAWWQFVGSVTLPPFGSAETAATRLDMLADPQSSPLVPLLKAVATHTWGDSVQRGLPGSSSAAGSKDTPQEIAAKFGPLHDFVRPVDKGDAPVVQYLQTLSRLHVLIRSYLDANRPKGQEDAIRQEVETALQATNGLLRALDPRARDAIEALLKQPLTSVLGVFKAAVPERHLVVGGTIFEDKKPLDGATVVLLEPYQDNKFQAAKELLRAQARAGAFTFTGPVEVGGYKLCAARKGSQDYYCGDLRISGETKTQTFVLTRGKTLLVFGGGKLTVNIQVRYLNY